MVLEQSVIFTKFQNFIFITARGLIPSIAIDFKSVLNNIDQNKAYSTVFSTSPLVA